MKTLLRDNLIKFGRFFWWCIKMVCYGLKTFARRVVRLHKDKKQAICTIFEQPAAVLLGVMWGMMIAVFPTEPLSGVACFLIIVIFWFAFLLKSEDNS